MKNRIIRKVRISHPDIFVYGDFISGNEPLIKVFSDQIKEAKARRKNHA